jgi:hypothetical protein
VLAVLVERNAPRHLRRRGIDLDGADQRPGRFEDIPGDVSHGTVGNKCDTTLAAVAVLDDCMLGSQIEGNNERPRAVGRGKRTGFPTACSQPPREVLEPWLRRGKGRGQLAEHLGMGVKGVAGLLPLFVLGKRRPLAGTHFSSTV